MPRLRSHALIFLSLLAAAFFGTRVGAQGAMGGQWTLVGESGVSVMHAMLMPATNKIVFLDKWQTSPFVEVQNVEGLGAEYDLDTNSYRPLSLSTNTFCSAGGYLPNGTMVSIGGSKAYSGESFGSTGAGWFSIRVMDPCNDATCTWTTLPVKLGAPRWYPTVEALSDGTLFILGGSSQSTEFNNNVIAQSTFELFPPRPGFTKPQNFSLLLTTLPNNLYPIVFLLPEGSIFVFANVQSQVVNGTTFQPIANLPNLPGVSRSYPVTGGGALLPLTSRNEYLAEVLVCGGSQLDAASNKDSIPTNTCGRIKPLVPGAQWETDTMPSARVMPDMLHMADGNLCIVNGAMHGVAGWGDASLPNYVPLFYNAEAALGQRWSTGTPSMIARMYHSVAMTVPDGRVLVAGSNPNENPSENAPFPSDFRVEMFTPPFLLQGIPQPEIHSPPTVVKYGVPFTLVVTVYQPQSTVNVSISASGFVTHSVHMSARYVWLDTAVASPGVLTVQGPPSPGVLPPSYYLLRVVENGVPSKAVWVQVTA